MFVRFGLPSCRTAILFAEAAAAAAAAAAATAAKSERAEPRWVSRKTKQFGSWAKDILGMGSGKSLFLV